LRLPDRHRSGPRVERADVVARGGHVAPSPPQLGTPYRDRRARSRESTRPYRVGQRCDDPNMLEHRLHVRAQGRELALVVHAPSLDGRDEAQIAHATFDHWRQRRAFVVERWRQKLGVGMVSVLMSAYAASIPAIELTDWGLAAGVSVIVFWPVWFCATFAGALTIALWAMV